VGPARKQTPEQIVAAWEAKSPEQVKGIRVPETARPEVKRVAVAYLTWKRAEWVYGQVRLPEAPKYSDLDADHLNVGDVGRLPGAFTTVRIDSDAVVFRTARGTLFAFSGLETSTMVSDRGYTTHSVVECYRTAKFGLYTLPVVRHKVAQSVNSFDAEVDEVGRQRVKTANKELLAARAKLSEARLAAIEAATAAASAEAARQIQVPKNGSAQDQIRAKVAFERLERKLQDEARQKAEEEYADLAPKK
jgi:hypothetical protein